MRQLKISKQITNRKSDSLDKYLLEISKKNLISAEEEVFLARQIQQGNMKALEKLVTSNLRFVVSVSKQYQNQGLSLNDLINEGNLGLIKAALRFDETRGFKFISYAVWWIRQSIMQALAEHSRLVRIPLNRLGDLSKINKVFAQLEQEFERIPSPEEMAECIELSAEEIKRAMTFIIRHKSIDDPLLEGEEGSLLDVMPSSAPAADQKLDYQESLESEINKVLSSLNDRQKRVIELYFGLDQYYPMTLEEIGKEIGLTRERVRQIKDRAILKLRSHSNSKGLKAFLGQ